MSASSSFNQENHNEIKSDNDWLETIENSPAAASSSKSSPSKVVSTGMPQTNSSQINDFDFQTTSQTAPAFSQQTDALVSSLTVYDSIIENETGLEPHVFIVLFN